jgi:ABC-type transporter lipoprotein component MlaA
MMSPRLSRSALCTFLLALGAGLAPLVSPAAAEPERYSWEVPNTAILGVEELEESTHAETFGALQYMSDPIQPFNRFSLRITKPLIDWVLVPVGKGFRFLVPVPVRQSLDRFSYNFTYPGRLVSLLLQGELRKSGLETAHFVTNTTLGIAGLFDPASGYGIPTHADDVGKAFARWGIGPGFYVFLPLLGPSSARDSVGRIFDTALNPLVWVPVPGIAAFFNVNSFTFRIDGYETLSAAFPDLYLPVRALWSIQRQIKIEDYEIPEEAYATADPEPSLGALLFEPDDPNFVRRAEERSVEIPTTGADLPYSVWLQDHPAPLVFLVPGIGAHRLTNIAVALAEKVFERGYSVAVVSSPFHPEFIARALSADYPGYTPSDAEDVYTALSQIWNDLRDEHGDRVPSARLMGYSLGGIETLFIAAEQENRSPDDLHFESFVAINPPVDLGYAGRRFDAYFDAPLQWPPADRAPRIRELVMKAFIVMMEGLRADGVLPFDRQESEFVVGFSGRMTLADTLMAIRRRGAAGLAQVASEDGRGDALLASVLQSSFERYFYELAFPYFAERIDNGADADSLVRAAGLRSLADALRGKPTVHVVTNADDFILGDRGLAWLREHLGDRVTVFPGGGHMGNIFMPEVHAAILAALGEPPAVRTAATDKAPGTVKGKTVTDTPGPTPSVPLAAGEVLGLQLYPGATL